MTCFHKGLLGGANAFHFLTFVVGLVTLVVNVENNLNQNNNNLNGINVNANRQTNNNANANNNAMNMIEVSWGRTHGDDSRLRFSQNLRQIHNLCS